MMQTAQTPDDVLAALNSTKDPVIIGFFGDFSAASRQARPAFQAFAEGAELTSIYVDVGAVKGVHKRFGVASVPTVVVVKDDDVIRKVIGPQSAEYYERALVPHAHVPRKDGEEDKPSHRVTVYTGAHCSWCTRVKNYLNQQRVRFTEIDVSADPNAARSLQAKTGQTGVPQIDIDGQWVVGFDKPKINKLLDLNSAG